MSAADKQALRADVLARRRRRTPEERIDAGRALAAHVAAEAALSRPRRIAVYLSMTTEPPTGPMIDVWWSFGREVLVPVVTGSDLDWVRLTADAMTAPSPIGAPEPTGPRLGAGALAACDLVVVPALAADHAGHRLGRGAGYYDRALAEVTAPVTAVVFTDELLPDVPHEPHDVPVSSVLTPGGLFRVP